MALTTGVHFILILVDFKYAFGVGEILKEIVDVDLEFLVTSLLTAFTRYLYFVPSFTLYHLALFSPVSDDR